MRLQIYIGLPVFLKFETVTSLNSFSAIFFSFTNSHNILLDQDISGMTLRSGIHLLYFVAFSYCLGHIHEDSKPCQPRDVSVCLQSVLQLPSRDHLYAQITSTDSSLGVEKQQLFSDSLLDHFNLIIFQFNKNKGKSCLKSCRYLGMFAIWASWPEELRKLLSPL